MNSSFIEVVYCPGLGPQACSAVPASHHCLHRAHNLVGVKGTATFFVSNFHYGSLQTFTKVVNMHWALFVPFASLNKCSHFAIFLTFTHLCLFILFFCWSVLKQIPDKSFDLYLYFFFKNIMTILLFYLGRLTVILQCHLIPILYLVILS